MKAFNHEAVSGLTSFREVVIGDDLAIPLEENQPGGRKVYPRALFIGVAGSVTVRGVDDVDAVAIQNLAVGVWHPMCLSKVTAATAGSIFVGY